MVAELKETPKSRSLPARNASPLKTPPALSGYSPRDGVDLGEGAGLGDWEGSRKRPIVLGAGETELRGVEEKEEEMDDRGDGLKSVGWSTDLARERRGLERVCSLGSCEYADPVLAAKDCVRGARRWRTKLQIFEIEGARESCNKSRTNLVSSTAPLPRTANGSHCSSRRPGNGGRQSER